MMLVKECQDGLDRLAGNSYTLLVWQLLRISILLARKKSHLASSA